MISTMFTSMRRSNEPWSVPCSQVWGGHMNMISSMCIRVMWSYEPWLVPCAQAWGGQMNHDQYHVHKCDVVKWTMISTMCTYVMWPNEPWSVPCAYAWGGQMCASMRRSNEPWSVPVWCSPQRWPILHICSGCSPSTLLVSKAREDHHDHESFSAGHPGPESHRHCFSLCVAELLPAAATAWTSSVK